MYRAQYDLPHEPPKNLSLNRYLRAFVTPALFRNSDVDMSTCLCRYPFLSHKPDLPIYSSLFRILNVRGLVTDHTPCYRYYEFYHVASVTACIMGGSSTSTTSTSRLLELRCNAVDDSFGPVASKCRFDFTVLFEESILFLGPSVLFLILAALRIWQLRRAQSKVRHAQLQVLKIVSSIGQT
jgi:hypothetical protein